MTTSPVLLETFQSLLDSSPADAEVDFYDNDSFIRNDNDDAFDNLDELQGRLCQKLHQQLQQELGNRQKHRAGGHFSNADVNVAGENVDPNIGSSTKNQDDFTNSSIRSLFPDQRVSDLMPLVVTPLLNSRVETQQLLPGTQDVDANEEVLDNKAALSLTVPALQAGRLYALLLRCPGALGSGLVELEPLTALVALVRRWNLECCGRERDALASEQDHSQESQELSPDGGSPSKSPPKKRWRANTADTEDDFQENAEQLDSLAIVKENVLAFGSLVALEVSKIAQQPEFASWSTESREILLDAIVSAMGTAAALVAGRGSDSDGIFTAQCILEEGKRSLMQCIGGKAMLGKENQLQLQRYESSIVVLRGLMHFLQQKVVLPNGERGLQSAHDMAGQVVALLMQMVRERTISDSSAKKETHTPNRMARRRSSMGSIARTPKSASKIRLSTGAMSSMTSPVLKKNHARSPGVGLSLSHKSTPRGVPALFVGLLQKLATGRTGLEKAALRKSTVKTIFLCLEWMPHAERAHFLRYILKICHSKISVHRLVACELLGEVLAQRWLEHHTTDTAAEDDNIDSDNEDESPSCLPSAASTLPQALWKALQGRLVDRISSVRAAAAASLECAVSSAQKRTDTNKTILNSEEIDQLLMSLMRRAVKDETATVRKTSIVALAKLLTIHQDKMSDFYLAAICDLCQDTSLLTRRAAAESLTMLLQVFSSLPCDSYHLGLIEDAWSSCVLPMVLDEETSAKAVSSFLQIVVAPVLDDDEGSSNQLESAWRILSGIGNMSAQQGTSKGAFRALEKALSHLMKEDPNLIRDKLVTEAARVANDSLQHGNLGGSRVVGVWCLIDALLSIDGIKPKRKTKKFDFCTRGWETILENHLDDPSVVWLRSTLKCSLSALCKAVSSMDKEEARTCQSKLLERVCNFSISPDVLGSAIAALRELSYSFEDKESNIDTWTRKVFGRCEEELSDFLVSITEEYTTSLRNFEPTVVRAIFTAGEVSVVGFNPEDDKMVAPTNDIAPSKRLKELIQIMVSDSLPGSGDRKTPTSIRAHAFTVLGKFCLRDEALARKSLTLLARELHPAVNNTNPSVQSNALLVLGDLCVRYTNMTDRYLPVMASCLQNGTDSGKSISLMDQSPVVRKHAVLLLSGLLLQDYIKWRGLLFHRFLVACCDDDEEVATLAETVLSGPLWVRNPKLFFNHFVESIFVLNRCTAHPIYISAANQGDGGSGIAVGFEGIILNGPDGESRRRQMYDFLLSKLSDEEKIGVTARLAKEVLGGAIESSGDLSIACKGIAPDNGAGSPRLQSAWNVLTDTFYVLRNKAIKVKKLQEDADAVALEDPNLPNATRQVTAAKNRLLSKISLKHMMEIVLPILCSLKIKLEASNSPLLKDLMMYLLEIFRSYKTEVKEFLANDPVLLQEIEYDARQKQQVDKA
jgi:condensin-2 complex subunit D3